MDYSNVIEARPSGGNFFNQLPSIIWHRKWLIVIPFLLGIVGSALAILVIPERYTAQATMLVESPQLPTDFIGQTESDAIDRRIAGIKQQITSRPDLVALIERYNLYPERRNSGPLSDIIQDMRDAIVLSPSATQSGGRGRDSETVAFQLSYTYRDAAAAQAVAQDLMERILQLDARGNVEQATNTVDFLTEQSNQIQLHIADLSNQIAEIKARNGMALTNNSVIMASNGGNYDVQIAALQRENQILLSQRAQAQTQDRRDPAVVAAENQLTAARAVYAESHPDVVIAKQRLAEARELAKSKGAADMAIDTIQSQLRFNNSQIAALQAAKAQDLALLNQQVSAQAQAPLVLQQISDLQRRLDGYNKQYEEVNTRLLSARAGVRAEDEQMTERLTVIEPPVLPDTPSFPNQMMIAAFGILGGLGFGLALAVLVEFLRRPIRDPESLEAILSVPPLGIIPVIMNESLASYETKRRRNPIARFLPGLTK